MKFVTVTKESFKNGYECDRILIKKCLQIDRVYTLEKIEDTEWRTNFYLKELPNIPFNSVNFIEVKRREKA